MSIELKVKLLDKSAELPRYVRDGDAAQDICSVEDVLIYPQETAMIKTGLAVEVPSGYVMHLYSRSGLASKGLIVSNGVGVIDSNYRGEICVLMTNTSQVSKVIKVGDRIAQIALDRVLKFHSEVVETLTETNRNAEGFGSSGQ